MRIIEPSVEIIREPDNMKRIELAGRTCYKSEAKITEESAERFCKMLISKGHTAMLEHSNIVVMPIDELTFFDLRAVITDYERVFGLPSMIRYGPIGEPFSGNVRAWRNVLKNGFHTFRDDPMFDDLGGNRDDLSKCVINQNVLTGAEFDKHAVVTIRLVCAEGVSLEAFRHRVAGATYEDFPAVCTSPAQESTRYCDYQDGLTFIKPYWYDNPALVGERLIFERHCEEVEETYKALREMEHAPQFCRFCLSKAIKTEIVLTQTVDRWNDWLSLRQAKDAHPDMRNIAQMVREAIEQEGIRL